MNTDSNLDIYLKAIQSMKEDDFSKMVLKPLFESMSFYRVDFYGGPYEEGKDLIALFEVPLKGDSVYVIQTKKIGEKSNTSEKAMLGDLILQLRQCLVKKVKLHNGEERIPDYVYLATPYQISSRLLGEIHELLKIDAKVIEILDGPKVIEYLKRFKPELLGSLLSIKSKVLLQDISQLQNLELISALKQKDPISELSCYNDLAFFMGTVDSNILLDSKISFDGCCFSLKKSGWDFLKKELFEPLNKNMGFNPLTRRFDAIEADYLSSLAKHSTDKNKDLRDKIKELQLEVTNKNIFINNILAESTVFLNSMVKQDENDPLIGVANGSISKLKQAKAHDFSAESLHELIVFMHDNGIEQQAKNNPKSVFPKFIDCLNNINYLIDTNKSLVSIQARYVSEPTIEVSLDVKKIESWVNDKVSFYKENIRRVNEGRNDVDIKCFLERTQSVLNVLGLFLNKEQDISRLINIKKKENSKRDGMSISPFNIFDTRHDIAVYGGAGAGKTTTLQMYAKQLIAQDPALVVYLALNRFINKVDISLDDKKESYEIVLSLILLSRGLNATKENIDDLKMHFLSESKVKIILDGLDEAFTRYNGIVESINSFKVKFPNIQIIISSRDCVSYLSQIEFLGITLLPFNEKQLYRFIRGWFLNKNKLLAEDLISSIKGRELFDVVKTPLLATLLCDLTEKGIDAPSTEYEIFSKRLELLCGMYDNYKDIKRTTLSQSILIKTARKIGYAFHERSVRSATFDKIVTFLINDRTYNFDDTTCELAVRELINPCNILVFDHCSETYSLGHLRYQEHLAAQEIIENRSIDIVSFLRSDWWRGALCLYAQVCEFMTLIEEFTIKYGNIEEALITLYEMATNRPKSERKNIIYLLKKYEETDDYYVHEDMSMF